MALPSIYIKGCLPFCNHQYLSTFTTVITTSTIEMDAFLGKFKLASQDNFDAYLKALDVNFALRTLALAATPSVTYAVDGDVYSITTTGMRDYVIKFQLDTECDAVTPDGRTVKNVFTLEDGKLVQKESWDDKSNLISRQLTSDGMIVTIAIDDIVCTRTYNRV